MGFDEQYSIYLKAVEKFLNEALPVNPEPWPDRGIPQMLNEAMRYSLLSGGKRLRPVLLLASYHLMKDDYETVLPFAAAIEMIHTYSLIHDDLPAMDNDDLRRGKPTSHKAFGEGTAILTGDALLNLAFEIMSGCSHPYALKAIKLIAGYTGASGMIAGQAGDINMVGKEPNEKMLLYIHRHKTADLITSAIVAGLCLAGCDEKRLEIGRQYGYHIGMAFQIADDLLDVLGTEDTMGKRVNKDESIGKLTWPLVYGIDGAKASMEDHIQSAETIASSFESRGQFLIRLAEVTLKRIS